MADDPYTEFAKLVACEKRGSVVAAAGCGKTEQIARATQFTDGRRLILTHTHAGVDALRARLKRLAVSRDRFRLDTIAGWCLRYAGSYPTRSGLRSKEPQSNEEWVAIYDAATALLKSGAVENVLAASYSGVFVDEYQDCTGPQHKVIEALAHYLPACIFGDPLQAIFGFKGQPTVDWDTDVFPVFNQVGTLEEPWRWRLAGNDELADWLTERRKDLEAGKALDFAERPGCINWKQLPDDPRYQQPKVIGTCKQLLGIIGDDRLVVIADQKNINARAALAQSLAKAGFSNIEPISCEHLYKAAAAIEPAQGMARLEAAMDFLGSCMTGTEKSEFLKAVNSHQSGGKRGATKFGDLIACGLAVAESTDDDTLLALLEGCFGRDSTYLYRREMLSAMRSALRIKMRRQDCALSDAIWDVQNRIRHAGRRLSKRSIGSTLLVKGLEFDHAVIVHSKNMTRRDWYVALTRAATSITIVSPSEIISPPA